MSPLQDGPQEPGSSSGSTPEEPPADSFGAADPPRQGGAGREATTVPGSLTAARAIGDEVDALLRRYDAAITGLYADPLAAEDEDHPLTVAWLDVVVAGSELDRVVRGRIIASGRDDSMAIIAGAEGSSFVNTATRVTPRPDGSVEWTNCGYAPGIGVDMRTGAVVDDQRASTLGRGSAVRSEDGELRVSELWDDETRLLEPNEADPCPGRTEQERNR